MAIAFRGAGALATTTTNSLTFTLPAGVQQNDLIIVHIGAGEDSPEPVYVSGMTGYTIRGNKLFLDYGPGSITQWIYWKVAGASESNPSITINDGGSGLWGYAMAFSGVDTASPFDLAAVSQGVPGSSSATYQPPTVDTQSNDAWVVSLVQTSDNNILALNTANSFTLDVGGASYGTDVGLDASFGMAHRLIASPTTVTLPVWEQTSVSPDYWAYQTLGLKPAGGVTTRTGSFSANAVLKKTINPSTTANAIAKKTQQWSTTVDALILKPTPGSTTADADIFGTVAVTTAKADAILFGTIDQVDFSVDASLVETIEDSFSASALVLGPVEDSTSLDADILGTVNDAALADAIVLGTVAGLDFSVDAFFVETIEDSFASDAILLATIQPAGGFLAEAWKATTVESSYSVDAFIEGWFYVDAVVSAASVTPIWTTPANGVGISSTPTLAFEIPDLAGYMHFHMEIDTADTFDTPNLVSVKTNYDQTGWEYWTGSAWLPFPSTGVTNFYAGNEARYTVQSALASGTWYRRVRAGT